MRGSVAIPAAVDEDFRGRYAHAYEQELRAWAAAILHGGSCGPSAWDGYEASAVADACLHSLAAGGPATVGLAPRPGPYA